MPDRANDILLHIQGIHRENSGTDFEPGYLNAPCPTTFDISTIGMDDIPRAESRIRHALPDVLVGYYTTIGNGGTGPGNGILGLTGGVEDSRGKSALDLYDEFRAERSGGEPEWPEGLLPLCEWDTWVYSSVWCARPDFPVIRHDSRLTRECLIREYHMDHMVEHVDRYGFFRDYGSLMQASWVEASSIYAWLEAWIQGRNVYRQGYPVVKGPADRDRGLPKTDPGKRYMVE